MEWEDISNQSRQIMDTLGEYSPTANPRDRQVKGVALSMEDRNTYKSYLDSNDLRKMAAAFVEVADWLDKRAAAHAPEVGA